MVEHTRTDIHDEPTNRIFAISHFEGTKNSGLEPSWQHFSHEFDRSLGLLLLAIFSILHMTSGIRFI
jgi:hypothetical protein